MTEKITPGIMKAEVGSVSCHERSERPILLIAVEPAMRSTLIQRRLALENPRLREQLQGICRLENIVGRSQAMARVFELVRKAARSEANILVVGESGTGKELIARAIHANSPRASEAFVPVDCASLPENLLESELFGHEKGAFTGAARAKPGLVEAAHRGTVFLDEIAELPVGLQVKLLRALQERQVRRVGATRQIDVDVRVVSATNRDLQALVAAGQFREDLYYRVDVIAIQLPPLRDRPGDVTLLAHHFLRRYGERPERPLKGLEPDALQMLEAYPWPGNVRELQNVIERACALADGDTIAVRDLPEHLHGVGNATSNIQEIVRRALAPYHHDLSKYSYREQMAAASAEILRHALRKARGNQARAADALRLPRGTFSRKIYDVGIDPESYR